MGKIVHVNQAAPVTPDTGRTTTYVDSASKTFRSIDDTGTIIDYSNSDGIHFILTKTSNYTIVITDDVTEIDATSGTVDITLPTAVGNAGRTFIIICKSIANTSRILSIGGQGLGDQISPYTIQNVDQTFTYMSNNIKWVRLA